VTQARQQHEGLAAALAFAGGAAALCHLQLQAVVLQLSHGWHLLPA
jgi:hypothetical protein